MPASKFNYGKPLRFPLLVGMAVMLAGCSTGREVFGKWVSTDAAKAPTGLTRFTVNDEKHLVLDNGTIAEYSLKPKQHTIQITFPDRDAITYGFSRSGENLTLVDGTRKVKFLLDQGG